MDHLAVCDTLTIYLPGSKVRQLGIGKGVVRVQRAMEDLVPRITGADATG
jgi:hypothetical protein